MDRELRNSFEEHLKPPLNIVDCGQSLNYNFFIEEVEKRRQSVKTKESIEILQNKKSTILVENNK